MAHQICSNMAALITLCAAAVLATINSGALTVEALLVRGAPHGVHPKESNVADAAFLQFDTQLYFFGGKTPFGTGAMLPFTTLPGHSGSVFEAFHDTTTDVVLLAWSPCGNTSAPLPPAECVTAGVELWGARAPALAAAVGPDAAPFNLFGAFPFGTRFAAESSGALDCGGSSCLVAASATTLFRAPIKASAPLVVSHLPLPLPPAQVSVRQVAIQFTLSAEQRPDRVTLLVATNAGLSRVFFDGLQSPSVQQIPLKNMNATVVNDSDVTQVFCLPASANPNATKFMGGQCFASTNEHFSTENSWTADLVHRIAGSTSQYFYKTPGIIDARPSAMAFDARMDAVHMVNEETLNILFANGTLERVGGYRGKLPQKYLSAAAATASGSHVLIGSARGGAMLLQNDDETSAGRFPRVFHEASPWRYFFGPRWLPGTGFTDGMRVSAVTAVAPTTVSSLLLVVATDNGLSVIAQRPLTLLQKAILFQGIVYPRHDRFGLCADVSLNQFGNLSTYVKHPNDNDGLWTSMYLASQAFRYAATGDNDALANARNSFNGLRLLVNATGIRGYMGRSVDALLPSGDCPWKTSADWHVSNTMPDFCWHGTTSSDEVTGHLHAYPIFHDLVAQTAAEKQAALQLIMDITSHLVDNNFTLVGYHGVPTQWGHWDPATLNGDQFWYDERGVNSLQILAFLSSAYRLTGAKKFADAFYFLVDEHGYAENVINAKITQPSDINYSDDELTFLPYLTFMLSGRPSEQMEKNPLYEYIKDKVFLSITKTFRYVEHEMPDLWTYIYLIALEQFAADTTGTALYPNMARDAAAILLESKARLLGGARFNLETQPLSWINWPTNNGDRLDVVANPHPNRKGQEHSLIENLLPYDEITLLRWNGNPYAMRMGSGFAETDPTSWLYPYWLGRYANFIAGP